MAGGYTLVVVVIVEEERVAPVGWGALAGGDDCPIARGGLAGGILRVLFPMDEIGRMRHAGVLDEEFPALVSDMCHRGG